jgi:hypothetical protein
MIGHELKLQRNLLFTFIFCLASLGFGTSAHADSSSVRAARLTYLQGSVTVNPPDNSGAVPAQLNLPLLSGVQLLTGGDGQAEVEFEDGSVARLTPNSALSLDNLAVDPNGVFNTNLSLLRGLAYFELRATPQYVYSVNAGGDVLSPVENATVRVNLDEPPAIFAVLDGTVQVGRQNGPNAADGYQTSVRAGESLRADPGDASRYFLTQEIDQDSWDQWNEDQDQAAATEASGSTSVRNNYEGAQGYGWSDLDANGSWYNVPGQGPVWQPDVAVSDASFDPYGDGAWVDYSGVGYVWASAYSWGWTPYRCGNWSYFNSFGWGWAPGSSCGGLGWGFVGGGRPVNVVIGPGGYRPIRVPTPGHGPWRPLLPVRATNAPQLPVRRFTPVQRGPRQIAGTTVSPIRPVGGGVTITNGSAVGSSLRRDFPINASTKAPVMGTASTSPAAVHTYRSSGGRVAGSPPSTTVVGPVTNQPPAVSYPSNPNQGNGGDSRRGPGQSSGSGYPSNNGQNRQTSPSGATVPSNNGQYRQGQPSGTPPPSNNGQVRPVPSQPTAPAPPVNNGQFRPAPTSRPQQPQPDAQRPPQQPSPQQNAPAQRNDQDQRRSAPPQAPSHPPNSPPPAPPPSPAHTTYSPPPAAPPPPASHPSSPPPSSASQERNRPN